MNVHARWEDAAADATFIDWAREVYRATAPFAAAGAYVNFLTQDEQERVRAAYGGNYERLAAVKTKYDPGNFFRVNQNIVPSTATAGPETMARPAAPTAARPRASSEAPPPA